MAQKLDTMEVVKKSKGFFSEFKEFITKGNVMDMAVGVIIGAVRETQHIVVQSAAACLPAGSSCGSNGNGPLSGMDRRHLVGLRIG